MNIKMMKWRGLCWPNAILSARQYSCFSSFPPTSWRKYFFCWLDVCRQEGVFHHWKDCKRKEKLASKDAHCQNLISSPPSDPFWQKKERLNPLFFCFWKVPKGRICISKTCKHPQSPMPFSTKVLSEVKDNQWEDHWCWWALTLLKFPQVSNCL